MTDYEKVREAVARDDWTGNDYTQNLEWNLLPERIKNLYRERADKTLNTVVDNLAIAIVRTDGELPDATRAYVEEANKGSTEGKAYVRGYYIAQQDIGKAGYTNQVLHVGGKQDEGQNSNNNRVQ